MNNRFYSLTLFAILLSLTSCVRYIDSRKELMGQYDDYDPAQQRVGIQGFYQYEQEQRKLLEQLIQKREQEQSQNPSSQYRIGAGDEINLTVKNFAEVSKKYTVGPDGSIRVPFIGSVDLSDLSENEASNLIAELISDYVVEPQVDLEVIKYSTNVVYVVNSFNRSGNQETKSQTAFPLKRQDYSLLDLIVDINDTGIFNRGVVHLYPASDNELKPEEINLVERFNNFNVSNWSNGREFETADCDGSEFDEETSSVRVKACYPYYNDVTYQELMAKYEPGSRIEIDIEELFGGVTKKPLRLILKPGDLIFIPAPPVVQVFGEVRRRGSIRIVASGGNNGSGGSDGAKPTLLSALSEAQGLTYAANINEVQIYREIHFGNKSILTVDLEKVVLWAGQDLRLRDGDIIYVPSQADRYFKLQSVDAINRITGSVTRVDDAYGADFER